MRIIKYLLESKDVKIMKIIKKKALARKKNSIGRVKE